MLKFLSLLFLTFLPIFIIMFLFLSLIATTILLKNSKGKNILYIFLLFIKCNLYIMMNKVLKNITHRIWNELMGALSYMYLPPWSFFYYFSHFVRTKVLNHTVKTLFGNITYTNSPQGKKISYGLIHLMQSHEKRYTSICQVLPPNVFL